MFIRSGTELKVAHWTMSLLVVMFCKSLACDMFGCWIFLQAKVRRAEQCKTSQVGARVLIASGEW